MEAVSNKPANYRRAKVVDMAKRLEARRKEALRAAQDFLVLASGSQMASAKEHYIIQADVQAAKAQILQDVLSDILYEFAIGLSEVQ